MLLVVLKHAGNSTFLVRMFNKKGSNFERLMTKFWRISLLILCDYFVKQFKKKHTYQIFHEKSRCFKFHPCARYKTDVCFQQNNRATGNMKGAMPWYSRKLKLHVYKPEASVLRNEIGVVWSDHAREDQFDHDILQSLLKFQKYASKKSLENSNIEDKGKSNDDHSDLWAILVGKGY